MADTQSNEQKFLNEVTVKRKGNPVFIGNLGSFNGNFVYSQKSKEAERQRLFSEKEELLKKLSGEDLKDLLLLQSSSWDILSNAQRENVLNLVKTVFELSQIKIDVDTVQQDVEDTYKKCVEILKEIGLQTDKISYSAIFSNVNLSSLITQIDNGKIEYYTKDKKDIPLFPSAQDLEIVSVLKMAGFDLQFKDNLWSFNNTPNANDFVLFAPKKGDKPIQVFGLQNVKFLLDNYLNVPQAQRKQKVLPDKLFKVYVEEYESQLKKGRPQGSNDFGLIDQEVARVGRQFSTKSDEFKIVTMLDRDTMVRNAQKMAIANAFKMIVDGSGFEKVGDSIQKMVLSVPNNPAYSKLVKSLGKMVPMVDKLENQLEDAVTFEGEYHKDFVAEYDREIEYLKRVGKPDFARAVEKTKMEFQETVVIQQLYWESKLKDIVSNPSNSENKGNLFQSDIIKFMNESVGYLVQENEQGEFVMANGESILEFLQKNNLSSDTYNNLKKRIEEKKSLTPTSGDEGKGANEPEVSESENKEEQKKESKQIKKYPNIFFDYSALVQGVDFSSERNFVLDYSNIQLYKEMWKKYHYFDAEFEFYKTKNPTNPTIDGFIQDLKDRNEKCSKDPEFAGQPLFDPELVEDAYYLANPTIQNDEKRNRAQKKIEEFENHLLMSDLILQSFTPEQVEKYNDMPDSVKSTFLKDKYDKAKVLFDELKKDEGNYKAALELAKKRHENGIVGSVINTKYSDFADKKGPITSAVDAFLKDCKVAQGKNNKDLANAGEPTIIDFDKDEPENENDKKPTFGDIYPSGPNVNKFLKAMKPYSSKAIIKYFIEPLLIDMEAVEFDKAKLQEKMAPSSEPISEPRESLQNQEEAIKNAQEQYKITQRDFEASVFMPGSIVFSRLKNKQDKISNIDDLSLVFDYLSSTNKEMQKGKETEEKKDCRDALRAFALGICSEKQDKDVTPEERSKKVSAKVQEILTQYEVQDEEFVTKIKNGFSNITPALMVEVLTPISNLNGQTNNLEVGSYLPVEKLMMCQNDNQRRETVAGAMGERLFLFSDQVEQLVKGSGLQNIQGTPNKAMYEFKALQEAMNRRGMFIHGEKPSVAENDNEMGGM